MSKSGRTASSSGVLSFVSVCCPSVKMTITLVTLGRAPPSAVKTFSAASLSAKSMRVLFRWCCTSPNAAVKSLTLVYSPNLMSTWALSLYEITAICDWSGPILKVEATSSTNSFSLLKFRLEMLPEESTTNTMSDFWVHCSDGGVYRSN